MQRYGQYCPVSRASEILAERWTPLVVRNLLLGCRTFNAIAGGVPGMSRSLLSKRLDELQRAGILVKEPRADGRRGAYYQLTECGRGLWDVMSAMGTWAERWIELQPEHSDPSFVLWAWCHAHLVVEKLPARRVNVRFEFPDERPPHNRFWILFEQDHAELCHSPPGFDEDLQVEARSEPFMRWHVGQVTWAHCLRREEIRVAGPTRLRRALPTWNAGAHGQ